MATIRLEIDTETGLRDGILVSESMPTQKLAKTSMIVVATIHLNLQLRTAFETGAGQTPLYFDGKDYKQIGGILKKVDGPNRVIATGGGLVAFLAAEKNITTAKFVSLVGMEPTGNLGRCYGGVTLNSFGGNSARVRFLVANGRPRAGIGLFCNVNSPITQYEVQNWGTIAGVDQTIAYGGNTGGQNDSSHYLGDLNGADANITTLIISADPFFQDTKDDLIYACNQWVAGAAVGTTRYICYPFADYSNTNGNYQPTPGTASWYGADLSQAYGSLGASAADAVTATSPLPFASTTVVSGNF